MTERDAVLEKLIASELPNLRRFFATKVPQSEVLDLVQQTMLAFVEGRDRITGNERAYLRGIARFQVCKFYEKRKTSVAFDSTVHTATQIDRTLSTQLDERTRLLRALHELPLDQQIAFEMRHGEEMQLEDVAQVVGVSLATVKRYLSAAESKLKETLGEDASASGAAYREL